MWINKSFITFSHNVGVISIPSHASLHWMQIPITKQIKSTYILHHAKPSSTYAYIYVGTITVLYLHVWNYFKLRLTIFAIHCGYHIFDTENIQSIYRQHKLQIVKFPVTEMLLAAHVWIRKSYTIKDVDLLHLICIILRQENCVKYYKEVLGRCLVL